MFDSVELFFTAYKNTAWAFFSLIALIVALTKIINFARAIHKTTVDKAIERALIKQRQKNQAEVIDELLKVIHSQSEENRRYCAVVSKYARETAAVKLLLNKNNITIR